MSGSTSQFKHNFRRECREGAHCQVLGQTDRQIAGVHGAAVNLGLHLNTQRLRLNKLEITAEPKPGLAV